VPIQWNRVYNLPDYVFFNHSVHVNNGIGCSSCHGQVDQMPLMRQNQPLFMRWCLECHTAPEKYLRPKDQIYNMSWTPGPNQIAQGQQLIKDYKIDVSKLKNCTTCHR
jgi:hypothetical protein